MMEWCYDCGEEFRYDDTGGYNPPCQCKFKCRSCCESECEDDCPPSSPPDAGASTEQKALADIAEVLRELGCLVGDHEHEYIARTVVRPLREGRGWNEQGHAT